MKLEKKIHEKIEILLEKEEFKAYHLNGNVLVYGKNDLYKSSYFKYKHLIDVTTILEKNSIKFEVLDNYSLTILD